MSVPDDPNNIDLLLLDELNGKSYLGGVTVVSNLVPVRIITNLYVNTVEASNINVALPTSTVTFNGTNTTVGGSSGTGNIARGSFGRLKINGSSDTANADIYNSNGTGMTLAGAVLYLSAGVNAIFAGTSATSSFTNDLKAQSISPTNGITMYSNSIPVAVTVGASPFLFTNKTTTDLRCNIGDSTSITTSYGRNGVTLHASTTDLNLETTLYVNEYITLTYSGGTPTLFTNR